MIYTPKTQGKCLKKAYPKKSNGRAESSLIQSKSTVFDEIGGQEDGRVIQSTVILCPVFPNPLYAIIICSYISSTSARSRFAAGYTPTYLDSNRPCVISMLCGPIWKGRTKIRGYEL